MPTHTRLLLTAILLLVGGCLPVAAPPPTPRPFPARDLVIDSSVMPTGWYVSSQLQQAPYKWGQEDSAFIQFDARAQYGGVAQHQVYQLFDASQAKGDFSWRMPGEYFSSGVIGGWHAPSELPYHSPVADQFRLACAEVAVQVPTGRITLCGAMAQYDEYLSIFNAHIIPGYMSYEDLGRILKAIDERMAHYLDK